MSLLRSLRRLRRANYTAARVLGDVVAVGSGHVARRVKNRLLGRLLRRLLAPLFR